MPPHKFKVGQNVVLQASRGDSRPASPVVSVTRLLPEEGGEPQYRIRIDVGGQERVVRESQLASTQTARAAEGLPGPVKKGTPLMAGSGRRGP